jgi:cytochrome c biogenesis protein ResB
MGYKVKAEGSKLKGEYGVVGRLAPSVTHVGLLTLLLGITITSWTGFTGFQPVLLDEKLNFSDSQHSKLWIGSLPKWQVRVDGTRRENYPGGASEAVVLATLVWLTIRAKFFIKAKYRSIIH